MTFFPRSRPNAPALLAIAVLHAALFSALLAQHYRAAPQLEGKELAPIQWLLPLAKPPAVKKPVPGQAPPQRPVALRAKAATRTEPIAPLPAAPVPEAAPAPGSDPFDLANTPPAPATEAMLRRQDWGAGKADHELRGGKLARLVKPTNTLQAGLERAFQEAGEAVPPKWFSAPEIREISVPDGRTRMYKIRTAMGTYCFYKPDPSLEARYDYKLMTCPREK
ncbi:hypothetical protein GCM10027277_45860 [Pseudoduganella ginsengisoli]|uniref:Uncharacterized protein n=1 Tax=Pseudoduganella ginsengisoli TaxID=1462440 RepID=A0A6L6Q7D6_9BURK|nr:hypothetical protein [Pseudoduganella ginsengisoli]MTW05687.1 hypothetical protein [Pseudoduganella ginsengisoli]